MKTLAILLTTLTLTSCQPPPHAPTPYRPAQQEVLRMLAKCKAMEVSLADCETEICIVFPFRDNCKGRY